MPINGDNKLHIWVLSVAQGDCSVILTPHGRVIVIDAVRPTKLVRLLHDLGLNDGEPVDELIITHPHDDHYSGAPKLIDTFGIKSATLPPFWNPFAMGKPAYSTIVSKLEAAGTEIDFVSGYSRLYPEGSVTAANDQWVVNPDALYLELLGPSNDLIDRLNGAGELDTNHLSIVARLSWGGFGMVFGADAQMENWADFDEAGMLAMDCDVLKAAHHGSKNGTQFERLSRLKPRYVVIPSHPEKSDDLPDVVGASIFASYSVKQVSGGPKDPVVSITRDTGSIEIEVEFGGKYNVYRYKETDTQVIKLAERTALSYADNPTDWQNYLKVKAESLYTDD